MDKSDELNVPLSSNVSSNFSKEYCLSKIKSFTYDNAKNPILGYVNINSLRNKFALLKPFINSAFDIFLVSETKIDSSFPNSQFS